MEEYRWAERVETRVVLPRFVALEKNATHANNNLQNNNLALRAR